MNFVTLRCASLSVSASQERKQRGAVFEILLESISTLLLSELALFCRKLFPSTFQDSGCPREDVDTELSASTADAVLEFSVLTLVNVSFASAPRYTVLQHSLAFWTFQSDSVFLSSSCFPAKINQCCDLDLKA